MGILCTKNYQYLSRFVGVIWTNHRNFLRHSVYRPTVHRRRYRVSVSMTKENDWQSGTGLRTWLRRPIRFRYVGVSPSMFRFIFLIPTVSRRNALTRITRRSSQDAIRAYWWWYTVTLFQVFCCLFQVIIDDTATWRQDVSAAVAYRRRARNVRATK